MKYKALKNHFITLNSDQVFDAGDGVIMIPEKNKKVYIHWYNDNDKMIATYTLQFSSLITGKVKLINAQQEQVQIHCIQL